MFEGDRKRFVPRNDKGHGQTLSVSDQSIDDIFENTLNYLLQNFRRQFKVHGKAFQVLQVPLSTIILFGSSSHETST